jgi:hypothetical protein
MSFDSPHPERVYTMIERAHQRALAKKRPKKT